MAIFEFLAGMGEDPILHLLRQSSSPRFTCRRSELKAPQVSKTSPWKGKSDRKEPFLIIRFEEYGV